jgi:hypothetical protein
MQLDASGSPDAQQGRLCDGRIDDTVGICRQRKPVRVGLVGIHYESLPWQLIVRDSADLFRRGHLSKDRLTDQFKLTCRNWECGIIIPAKLQGVGNSGAESASLAATFGAQVPVPMQFPASPFTGSADIGSPFLVG